RSLSGIYCAAAWNLSSSEVQAGQRVASTETSVKQYGHLVTAGSSGSAVLILSINAFIGFTTKKKITAEMIRKAITALMKFPYVNLLPLIVNDSSLKSG